MQKKYTQSESLHQYALELRQQCLGEEHLDTAESLQGLADLYRDWGKYEEAASLYRHSLTIREKMLGWESPLLLKTRQSYTAMLQSIESEAARAEMLSCV